MAYAQGTAVEEPASLSARQGFTLTLTLLGTLFAATFCAQLPARWTPAWLAGQRTAYAEVWPQGWAFFAAQPDEAAISVTRVGPGGRASLASSSMASQMSAANLWGLGRTSTAEFNEVRTLAAEVPKGDWIPCAVTRSAECPAKAPVVLLNNTFTPAIVCGEFAIVRTPPGVTAAKSVTVALVRVLCP